MSRWSCPSFDRYLQLQLGSGHGATGTISGREDLSTSYDSWHERVARRQGNKQGLGVDRNRNSIQYISIVTLSVKKEGFKKKKKKNNFWHHRFGHSVPTSLGARDRWRKIETPYHWFRLARNSSVSWSAETIAVELSLTTFSFVGRRFLQLHPDWTVPLFLSLFTFLYSSTVYFRSYICQRSLLIFCFTLFFFFFFFALFGGRAMVRSAKNIL